MLLKRIMVCVCDALSFGVRQPVAALRVAQSGAAPSKARRVAHRDSESVYVT